MYGEECKRYLSVARMLYGRGSEREALKLIRPLMASAREEAEEVWLDLLRLLGEPTLGYVELAFAALVDEIGDETEESEVLGYVTSLLGESELVRGIWQYVGDALELDLQERFVMLGKLYGQGHASVDEMEEAWEALDQYAVTARDSSAVYQTLLNAARVADDTPVVIDVLRKLVASDDEFQDKALLANYNAYVFNWKESAKMWGSLIEEDAEGRFHVGYYAGILLRLGENEKADALLREFDRKSLDEPVRLARMAQILESHGAWERAAVYWRRILMTDDPSTSPIMRDYLSSSCWEIAAEQMVLNAKNKKQWKLAAAASVVPNIDFFELGKDDENPIFSLRRAFDIMFYQALREMEEGSKRQGEDLLSEAFGLVVGDGLLADNFFPILREAGYSKLHDQFFEESFAQIKKSIEAFPRGHNAYNGAAWLASRASRRLDEAEVYANTALELRPRQAAYLDTMAEVWFARHDREKAIMWSNKSVKNARGARHTRESGVGLRAQHDRFLTGPFPVR